MDGQPAHRRCPFLARRIADSVELRHRVEAATQLGISLKRFDGWEPRQVTEYAYDDAGRLVRAVTRREVEWDEQQQAYALALVGARALTCDGCGGWLPETTTTDAEEYTVPPPYRCGRCTRIAIAQEAHGRDHKHLHATRWTATRRR
jgi:hypothetical protein